MAALTRESILAADDLSREVVPVPEWGGEVLVRVMTGRERDAFEVAFAQDPQRRLENLRARIVTLTAVDESGARLFTEADIPALGEKSAAALERLFEVAVRINALSPADIEALTKKSRPSPPIDSGSS